MASKGGGAAAKWWPKERSSRRDEWTQGMPIRLASGETWYMPAVDWSLAPRLKLLVSMAYHVRAHFGAFYGDGDHSDEMVTLVNDWFGEYLTTSLEYQYRNRRQTLSDLAYGRRADWTPERVNHAFNVVATHSNAVIAFSDRHVPAGLFLEPAELRRWLAVN